MSEGNAALKTTKAQLNPSPSAPSATAATPAPSGDGYITTGDSGLCSCVPCYMCDVLVNRHRLGHQAVGTDRWPLTDRHGLGHQILSRWTLNDRHQILDGLLMADMDLGTRF